MLDAETYDARVAIGNDFTASDIIGVDHGVARCREIVKQPFLGAEVAVGVLVIIQVIAAEIREHGRLKNNAVAAMLVERMAGHFHNDVSGAVPTGFDEELYELNRGRRGPGRVELSSDEVILDRAQQRRRMTCFPQYVANQVACRALAVGAGDGDDVEIAVCL